MKSGNSIWFWLMNTNSIRRGIKHRHRQHVMHRMAEAIHSLAKPTIYQSRYIQLRSLQYIRARRYIRTRWSDKYNTSVSQCKHRYNQSEKFQCKKEFQKKLWPDDTFINTIVCPPTDSKLTMYLISDMASMASSIWSNCYSLKYSLTIKNTKYKCKYKRKYEYKT